MHRAVAVFVEVAVPRGDSERVPSETATSNAYA